MADIPAEAFHPSVFVKEELEARGWSLDELAIRCSDGDLSNFGIERLAIDFYFEVGPTQPDLRMGDDGARLWAAVFDVSPEYFLNLEKAWLAWCATDAGRAALQEAGR